MVVHVPVDRQGAVFGKRLPEPLDLPSHLQTELGAKACGASTCQSACPEHGKPPIELAATIDEQVHLRRRRKWPALEDVQMEDDGQARTTLERGDGVFPTGAVDDHAGTA